LTEERQQQKGAAHGGVEQEEHAVLAQPLAQELVGFA
jgi:hypothetical protein